MTPVDLATTISDLQFAAVYVDQVHMRRREGVALPQGALVRWRLVQKIGYRLTAPNELRIKLDSKLQFEEGSPEPFDLEVSVVGVYQSKDPINEERIPDYTKTHSIPLLWPYVREAISDLTTRMGGPTLILPTLFVSISKKQEEVAGAPVSGAQSETPPAEEASERDAEPRTKRRKRQGRAGTSGLTST